MAALVVTAIAIPESLGFAVIAGLPVQTGLYCALLAPIIFAAFSSTKRLVVGADSATVALVASGGATIALAGTPEYANAIALLGVVTGVVLLIMSVARFGFLADLISQTVFVGFISGIGIQLLIGKLPEMFGLTAHGSLLDKISFLANNLGHIEASSAILSVIVVAIIVAGWRFRFPGALIALLLAVIATKVLNLHNLGIEVIGIVPQGLPSLYFPNFNLDMIVSLLPAAISISIVILAQSLAVTRNAAAHHEEKVKDNKDLMALGFANFTSAIMGGFAINGSPPRTSAGEMAGGRSQLVNVFMAGFIGLVIITAAGLFKYMPIASLAAIIFTIGLHLLKIKELKKIWGIRKSEFGIAMLSLVCVALLGAQKGLVIAVILSIVDRLRRQYHPHDEVLLQDEVYTEWANVRLSGGRKKHQLEAPKGLLVYRFNDAIFFENATYFLDRVDKVIKNAQNTVKCFILDASSISDIDYTAARVLERLSKRLNADDIQFGVAHVSPHLESLFKRYGLIDLIGTDNIFPGLRFAIKAYTKHHVTILDRIEFLNLSPKDYVVIGGAVLELLGIRETNDLDIVVNKKIYKRLNSRHWIEYIQDDGKRILSRSGYKIMLTWVGKDLADLQKSSILVGNVPIMSLNDLIECKTRLGRKKDLQDIASIKAYVRKSHHDNSSIKLSPAFARA